MKRYYSAKKVLPATLLEKIQKHVSSCYLWVPSRYSVDKENRDRQIAKLYFEVGMSTNEIAKLEYLSPRRVRQIVRATDCRLQVAKSQ